MNANTAHLLGDSDEGQKARRKSRRELLKNGSAMPFLTRLLRSQPEFFREVQFRPAASPAELIAASNLVYEEYLKCGYITPNARRWRFSAHQILPTTVTFIAVHRSGRVLGTLTLVEDSPLGLPMERIYKQELNALRLDGLHLAEVSMLAFNRSLLDQGPLALPQGQRLLLVIYLFRAMFEFLRSTTRVDELVACFHPKHDVLYQFLHMEALGGLKNHGSVKGSPAIARRMNIKQTEAASVSHIAHDLFFGRRLAPERFAGRLRFGERELKALFVEHSNILASLDGSRLDHVQRCYPGINLRKMAATKSILSHLVESLDNRSYLGYPCEQS